MTTLFSPPSTVDPAVTAAHAAKPHFIELLAIEKHGMPSGWNPVTWSSSPEHAPEGMFRIEGGVWNKRWKDRVKGTEKILFIKFADLRAFEIEVGQREGKCHKCWGCGQELAGTHVEHGPRYRKCGACNGTGKPAERIS